MLLSISVPLARTRSGVQFENAVENDSLVTECFVRVARKDEENYVLISSDIRIMRAYFFHIGNESDSCTCNRRRGRAGLSEAKKARRHDGSEDPIKHLSSSRAKNHLKNNALLSFASKTFAFLLQSAYLK